MKAVTAIGLDIGTTSVCAVLLDAQSGEVVSSVTLENDSFLTGGQPWERLQDPGRILQICTRALEQAAGGEQPACIGITGQMHGALYLNSCGQPLSPLYTWQDGRGDLSAGEGETYAQRLSRITGCPLATGYGAVTHYWAVQNNAVPKEAAALCTIGDYIALALCGGQKPVLTASNAASMGVFSREKQDFDRAALERAGINAALFPQVVENPTIVGRTQQGAVVCAALGDNQASFLGSVRDTGGVLLNVGTGSQISVSVSAGQPECSRPGLERRPCLQGRDLLVGSSLCGGRAYAMLEGFFRSVATMAGIEQPPRLYDAMEHCLQNAQPLTNPLRIATTFQGTREDPSARGSIQGLCAQNFTPAHFIAGTLEGIVQELYDFFLLMQQQLPAAPSCLVGSGNGVRENRALRRIAVQKFELPLRVPAHREEASFGAALWALAACGHFSSVGQAQGLIRYLPEEALL
ncbi:MAG TPA: hypothetical protein IAA58_10820 [Candidatus Gallacutalibacter stercoravium]|nr:hypothetical protein [Candidatus Gallacutalibacter stercoravium]